VCVRLNTVHWTGCDRSIRTPQQLRGLTSIELKSMGVKANMRLDQKTIDQVLAAVRRGKLPDSVNSLSSSPSASREHREKKDCETQGLALQWDKGTQSGDTSVLLADDRVVEKISEAPELKEYMKSCGLEAWHVHFLKHTCDGGFVGGCVWLQPCSVFVYPDT
jgi:hypothetical protein